MATKRHLVFETGKNSRDEHWYYLEVKEDGTAYLVHEWDSVGYLGDRISDGTEEWPLSSAQGKTGYHAAVEKARELGLQN
jgi:hypothetical protein